MNGPVAIRAITRHARESGAPHHDQDLVAVEAPVSLVVIPVEGPARELGLLMRTPGDDQDLAAGVLVTEGLIATADDLLRVELVSEVPASASEPGTPARIRAFVGPKADMNAGSDRVGSATSACGLCGRLAMHHLDTTSVASSALPVVSADVIHTIPDRVRQAQLAFAQTGGLHAAAVLTHQGELVAVREDVGRHNAVDKVVGVLLKSGRIPADDLLLAVSGRVAYEIVQKAVMGGLSMIVAVGAPTDLAVDAARAGGVTLIGFARDGRFNIYTHPHRVATGEFSPPPTTEPKSTQ